MHQALYRKWRPRTFDDVCGQEHITSVLRYEVENAALSHAYLFCGSRGTGKTTCAKILAKAANCLSPKNGSPCGECEACRAIDSGAATDVLEMDAASNNGVESIRDIRDEVVYTPSNLRYRVYIVDEVHMLSQSAFNALLKTLEEPPSHVIFILATTELHKLPATIVSRCQRFDFRRIATPVLAARVSFIAKEEGFTLAPEAALRIAKLAQGGMRDAISMLELCGSARREIDVSTVNEMMGSTGREGMIPLLHAILRADFDAIFAAVDEVVTSSRDVTVFWQDLISLYRDLLVLKTTDAAARYLDLTDSETEQLGAIAAGLSRARILAHCRLLEDSLLVMQQSNAVKRMVAELTLVRMCDPTLDTSTEGLLARIAALEDAIATGAVAVASAPVASPAPVASVPTPEAAAPRPQASEAPSEKAPVKSTPTSPTPSPSPTAAPTGRVLQRVRGFMNCVERVRRENSMLASFLMDARVFTDDKGNVCIKLENDFARMMLEESAARALVARALSAHLSRQVDGAQLIFELPDAASEAADTILDELLDAADQQ